MWQGWLNLDKAMRESAHTFNSLNILSSRLCLWLCCCSLSKYGWEGCLKVAKVGCNGRCWLSFNIVSHPKFWRFIHSLNWHFSLEFPWWVFLVLWELTDTLVIAFLWWVRWLEWHSVVLNLWLLLNYFWWNWYILLEDLSV